MLLPIVCWVCPMHHTIVAGLVLAMVSATNSTWSSGTPQASVTLSGVHLAISSLTLSMPQTRAARKSLSSHPFLTMCHITPYRKGISPPERRRTKWSALAAVRVKRGSTTMTFAPTSRACTEKSIDTGCASAAFEPMYMMALAFIMSLYEFVIDP